MRWAPHPREGRALGPPFQPTAGSAETRQRPGKPPGCRSGPPPSQLQGLGSGASDPSPLSLSWLRLPLLPPSALAASSYRALGTVLPPAGPRARPSRGGGLSCPLPGTRVPAVSTDLCPSPPAQLPGLPWEMGSFRGCPCLSPRLLGRRVVPGPLTWGGREARRLGGRPGRG